MYTEYQQLLFRYRDIVHKYLDAIWIVSSKKYTARNTMYEWLALQMNLSRDEAHVSKFDLAKCKEAIKILRPKYIQLYGKDLQIKEEDYMKLQTTCTYSFETAHIMPKCDNNYDGLYSRTYKLKVIVQGPQEGDYDMVIPFEELLEAIQNCVPNRMFISYEKDDVSTEVSNVLEKYGIPYLKLPYVVSSENLIKYLYTKISTYIKQQLGYSKTKIVQMELSSMDGTCSIIAQF